MTHHITAPARVESVDLVQDAVQRVWAGYPELAENARSRLSAALIEIVGNIVEHGAPGPDREAVTMEITIEVAADRVRAVIVDDARPVAIPLDKDMPSWAAESGRGLALARALADELRWERLRDGNRWTLICVAAPAA